MTTSRRISYVLSPPTSPVPYLGLPPLETPRHGHPQPLLRPREISDGDAAHRSAPVLSRTLSLTEPGAQTSSHPRHCLGVAAIALDTTTQLHGKSTPEGILYTGGRDGLVAGWELGIKLKRRSKAKWSSRSSRSKRVDWERLEDGAAWDENDGYDSEGTQDESDGEGSRPSSDEGEEVVDLMSGDERWSKVEKPYRQKRRGAIRFEDSWEVDKVALIDNPPKPTVFRQSIQTHTDWVNDLILCNMNQTVITASSDRTIRAWAPHSSTDSEMPSLIGVHRDYAKTLSLASQASVMFSGGLDRQILAWDINSPRPDSPLTKLAFPESQLQGGGGGIYALATNARGTLVAAGSPEKVVRIWDPRVGGSGDGVNSISKLVGHSDNIRAICLSDDGRYLLSGSSDCTIKLWSLSAQRCLHTFSHHNDSVWAVHSDHPNLERFYSGDRSGYLCVTDVEGCTDDFSEAECVLLAQEEMEDHRQGTQGICQIVGMDEEFVWTATGSASVKRWKDVGKKSDREGISQPADRHSASDRGTPLLSPASGAANLNTPPALTLSPSRNGIGTEANAPRYKRASMDGITFPAAEFLQSLLRTDSRDSRTVAFAPEPSTASARIDSPRRVGSFIQNPDGTTTGLAGTILPPQVLGLGRPASLNQRLTTLSGASVAGSVMSVDSCADGPPLLNGLPYTSFICLGIPETPYMPNGPEGNSGYAGSVTSVPFPPQNGFAAMSRSSSQHHRAPSTSSHAAFGGDPVDMARREYLNREVAEEATPVRDVPDEVIRGRHGLIRAAILSDRQHVLTVDTSGEMAVWNIIKGTCVGRFHHDDVADIVGHDTRDHKDGPLYLAGGQINPREALELVRERVEGESMTVTWCSVDTRIGSLTVHLEESRCFDADVYADEAGFGPDEFKEDHRINLGKWVLANLFSGLVKAEERDLARYAKPEGTIGDSSVHSHSSTGISRLGAPMSIAIEIPAPSPNRRLRSMSSLSTNVPATPGGHIIGLATPAITPAILPNVSSTWKDSSDGWPGSAVRDRDTLAAIPQSPFMATNTPGTNTPTGNGIKSPRLEDPGSRDSKDYFSFRSSLQRSNSNVASKEPSPTRQGEVGLQGPVTPAAPATPGKSGLMGRFKGLGGKGKKTAAPEQVSFPSMPEDDETEELAGEKDDPNISAEEAAQLKILASVRSHPFYPPPPFEAPPITFPPSTALLISEETKDAGAWAVTYRSMVGRTEEDIEPLEMAAPGWTLEYLFAGRGRIREPVKLCFLLEPAVEEDVMRRLPAMPVNNSRLTANRVLRIRKVVQYIYDKLELGQTTISRRGSSASGHSQPASQRGPVAPVKLDAITGTSTPLPFASIRKLGSSAGVGVGVGAGAESAGSPTGNSVLFERTEEMAVVRAEDELEVVCCGVVVPVTMTLAAVRHFIWNARGGGIGDVVLYYRRKSGGGGEEVVSSQPGTEW